MKFISEYKRSWASDFKEIVRFLETYLPDGLLIHHIGSTSVPEMPAKDIIDIDIECPLGSMSRVIAHLADAGYEHVGDQGVASREAFRPPDATSRDAYIEGKAVSYEKIVSEAVSWAGVCPDAPSSAS